MTNYNSKCPACGGAAYLGFVAVECSNPNCKNFIKVDVAPPNNLFPLPPIPPIPPPPPPPPNIVYQSGAQTAISTSPTPSNKNWSYSNHGFYCSFDPKIKLIPNSLIQISLVSNTQEAIEEYHRMQFLTSLFELVFRHSQEAVLAGGAARDIFLQRISEIVDFDFFVRGFDRTSFENDFKIKLTSLSDSGVGGNTYTPPVVSVGGPTPKFEVYECSVGKEKFQIIDCSDVAEHIQAFDFGLNMIAVSGISQRPTRTQAQGTAPRNFSDYFELFFWESGEFMIDNANKTLTFYPAKCLRPKSLTKRWHKMSAKFPNHKLAMG